MIDLLVAYRAIVVLLGKMTRHAVSIRGAGPARAAMGSGSRILVAFEAGVFFVAHGALIAVEARMNTVGPAFPGHGMALGFFLTMAGLAGGLVIVMAVGAKLLVNLKLVTVGSLPHLRFVV